MGRAIDLFVTYRFIKLLVTPFEKTDAYRLGIIDADGKRILVPGTTNKPTPLRTVEEKSAYTVLHKLVFNIKKIFAKVPGLRTKLGTYAAALFLLKDTFKESVDDPDIFEKEFMKYLKEQGYEIDDTISEEVIGFGEVLPKGEYKLANDILNKEEEELSAKKGDKVVAFDDEAPVDTILGVDIFPVVHVKTQEKIYSGNEREKIISYTLTSIQTILAQNRFAKIAYEYFKSLKEPYVSPIASNIIKPIILMSLIKLKVKNKLEFTNMNLKKSLNSIKNKIGEILGHYPNLLVNISELTPKAIPSSDIIKKYQRNL